MIKAKKFLLLIALLFIALNFGSCGGGGGSSDGGSSNNSGGSNGGGGGGGDIGKVEPLDPAKVVTDTQTGQKVVNDQILITFKDTTSENTAKAKIASINGEIVGYITGMNDYQVRIKGSPTLAQLKALVDQLNNDPDVEAAILNALVIPDQSIKISLVPDAGRDPKWFEGSFNWDNWGESDPGGRNWGLEAIMAPSAWDYNNEMSSIKIGIMDVGFQLDHEDLNIPLLNARNTADGGTMQVEGHGTHVAGIIGAESNDNNGITGIVWKKEIFAFRPSLATISNEQFKRSQIFEYKYGIAWLLAKECKILNFSLGVNFLKNNFGLPSDTDSDDVKAFIDEPRKYWTSFVKKLVNKNYNFLLIQSAGNDAIDAKWNGFLSSIDDPELRKRIIIVGAIKRNGIYDITRDWIANPYTFSNNFSNYGNKVDIVAPGEDIYSTVKNNGYSIMSGTSMAAPHVTGVAGLVWAINPNLTATQVKDILVGTADRPITYNSRQYKILNAKAAVEWARSPQATLPIPQPPTWIVLGKIEDAVKIQDANNICQDTSVSIGNPCPIAGTDIIVQKNGAYYASTVSISDGSYELILDAGTYTITPSKSGYTFSPPSLTVTVTNSGITGQDFAGTAVTSTVNLPETGQTTCYDTAGNVIACAGTGQDGELQRGVAWPSPRFTDNGNGTVTDNLTGLMWLKDANCIATQYPSFDTDGTAGDGAVTWQNSLNFVAGINNGTYSNCGAGYTDWRLPNIRELERLINYGQSNTATWLSTQGFSNVQAGSWNGYWSSSTDASDPANAWIIYSMEVGMVSSYDKTNALYSYYVWPVRAGAGGLPADLPETGQTTCYDETGNVIACAGTGQDGELQMGVAWPSPRFTDNGNGTVTDNLTGLMWLKDANCIATQYPGFDTDARVTWQNALNFVAGINNGTYSNCGASFTDWRLPNVNELESLINAEEANNATWLNGQGFSNVQMYGYWSSSTFVGQNLLTYAWGVNMRGSGVFGGIKTSTSNPYYVWPVRAGQ